MTVSDPTRGARPSARYWVSLVLAPFVFLAAFTLLDHAAQLDPKFLQDRASVQDTDASFRQPAQASCGPERVSLPHLVEHANTGMHSTWFCLQFQPAGSTENPQALLLMQSFGNLSVYLNGWFVAQTGPLISPLDHFRTAPLWFDLPAAALKSGSNVIQIRTTSEVSFNVLYPVYVGDAGALRPAYDQAWLIRVAVIDATIATMVIVCLLMLGMFALRRTDTVYAWFAATIAVWTMQLIIENTPRPLVGTVHTWSALDSIALGWFVCLASIFVNRVTGWRGSDTVQERAVAVFGIVGTALRFWPPGFAHSVRYVQFAFWVPGMLLIGALMLWRLAQASLRARNDEARMLLVAAFVVFAVGVRDYVADLNSAFDLGAFTLLPYTVSAVLTVYVIFLLKRVTGALGRAELLNRELEERVAEKVSEIEAFHARLLRLETQQAAQRERERMTRDMHDGLGGHLIHALSIAEANPTQGSIQEALRNALSDLRMVIDSAEQVDGDLGAVLAMMRSRCERRITQAGLRLDWRVGDLPPMPNLGAENVLQILRILDESLTNVIRHARATVVTVRAVAPDTHGGLDRDGSIHIEVEDNGQGVGPGSITHTGSRRDGSRGKGMRNMRRRAREIGAELSIISGATGTCVRLKLSLASELATMR